MKTHEKPMKNHETPSLAVQGVQGIVDDLCEAEDISQAWDRWHQRRQKLPRLAVARDLFDELLQWKALTPLTWSDVFTHHV